MNWETGALIAEIASAAGVIITLAYLASQITQTNRIATPALIRELEQTYIDVYSLIVTDNEVANLVTKPRSPSYCADSEVEDKKTGEFCHFASEYLA